jgi:hypothetical protein
MSFVYIPFPLPECGVSRFDEFQEKVDLVSGFYIVIAKSAIDTGGGTDWEYLTNQEADEMAVPIWVHEKYPTAETLAKQGETK